MKSEVSEDMAGAGGAEGSRVAQWVAIVDGAWVASVAVIAFRTGEVDYFGAEIVAPRANLIGVYVRPAHRRQGLLEALVATAAAWTAEQGFAELILDVHELNARAISAYVLANCTQKPRLSWRKARVASAASVRSTVGS